MHVAVVLLTWILLVSLTANGQQGEPKPILSDQPLSADQLAIYRAILGGWMDNGKGTHAVHLAIQTTPFHLDDMDADCGKGLQMNEGTEGEAHRFRQQDLPALRSGQMKPDTIRLVEPEAQAKEVAENDPDKSIHKGISIDAAVENGFAHGLVTLGEIHFDKVHLHAIVWYGFTCGSRCGNGATVILEKKNGVWGLRQHCSNWIS
jgi:hypothetical protein